MRGRLSAHTGRLGLALGLLLTLGSSGCHRQLIRLEAVGEHQEVVRRANAARRAPKGAAAQAWARSLVALGRIDEARAVLQSDYRHGGHVDSLVALADLELGQGLDGMAAAHYARVFSLETGPLRDREDVCAVFRERAREFLAQGEAVAAHVDMRRVRVLCGERSQQSDRLRDAATWGEIEAATEAQVRAQRALPSTEPASSGDAAPGSVRPGSSAAQRVIDRALEGGEQSSEDEVAAVLAAELGGRLGPIMLADDELRRLVGDQTWDGLVPALDRLDPAARAYAKLRLTAIRVSGLAEEQGERQRQRWAMQVMGNLGAGPEGETQPRAALGAWRALVVVGDLAGAELALTTSLRARLPASPAPAEAGPGRNKSRDPAAAEAPEPVSAHQDRVEAPNQWFGRVPVTDETAPELLALARLFTARGEDARALALARWVAAEAKAQGSARIESDARTMAHAWLEQGRPWSALAFVDVLGGSLQADTRAVAATQIELERVACGERCGEDRARREVENLMSEGWVIAELADLLERPPASPPTGRCPSLGELLAPDAAGPLPVALRATRDGVDSGTLASAYARAIESDVTLTCAAEHLLPLMAARGFTVTADKLSERLSHTPELESSGQFETHARLALLAGDEMRARTMIIAAAAINPRPQTVWRRAAEDGDRYAAPEYAAEAWRQLLLLDPRAADERARGELLLGQLRALATTFHGRETPVMREAVVRALEEWLARDPGRRWSKLEDLARGLAGESWADPEAARAIETALWDEEERARHPVGAARLARALGASAPPSSSTPMGFDLAALDLASGASAELPMGVALARPGAASHARLAATLSNAAGPVRTRALVAVAVTGAGNDRTRALSALSSDLARVDPEAARGIRQALAGGRPAAGPGLRPTPLLHDAEAQRRVLLGGDLERVGPAR
jgi:hypothetical protein